MSKRRCVQFDFDEQSLVTFETLRERGYTFTAFPVERPDGPSVVMVPNSKRCLEVGEEKETHVSDTDNGAVPYGGLAGLEQRLATLLAEREQLRQRLAALQREGKQLRQQLAANQDEEGQLRLARYQQRLAWVGPQCDTEEESP